VNGLFEGELQVERGGMKGLIFPCETIHLSSTESKKPFMNSILLLLSRNIIEVNKKYPFNYKYYPLFARKKHILSCNFVFHGNN